MKNPSIKTLSRIDITGTNHGEKIMNTRKQRILDCLDAFVDQRPGIDPRGYDSNRYYRADARHATKDRADYWQLRRVIEYQPISGEDLIEASKRAFSGRLEVTESKGKVRIHYTAGQYHPTEYRAAACAVLSAVLWGIWQTECPVEYDPAAPADESPGAWMRQRARNTFGQGIQRAWFC